MATLFFDLDGTLLDVRRRHYAVYAGALVELGVRPLPETSYWNRRREGEGTLTIIGEMPGDMRSRFTSTWLERIERIDYLKMDRVYDGAKDTLVALGKDHKLVLVTLRRDHGTLLLQLRCMGLAPYFEDRVISAASGRTMAKINLVSESLLDDGNIWVIGDSEADTELAAYLHANCLCLTNGVRSAAFLRAKGGRLFASSLRALPGLVAAAAVRG